ncbi:uncharacterized protein LOC126380785 [Pectinophora gossypiella]|uniref:uncharacterized protein LOC126380785 n=1 Tax=Pectinophora gossypiella TaxID=13191 RepID=UPI00214EF8CD|nr:uncharacterized protein LOC126380785 [Pectinophora gossypiella]
MDTLPELFDKVSLTTYDPDSSYHVKITHINNPHSFYARPTAYTTYLPSLEAKGEPINAEEVQLKDMVVFKSKTLNKSLRGSIFNIDNKYFDIFTPDYGFLEKKVPVTDIFKPKILGVVPPLAVHCRLANCKPITAKWEDKAIESMKFFVGEERALLCVVEKNPQILTVVLKNSCPDDISLMLAYCGHSVLGYVENQVSRLTSPPCQKLYYTYRELKLNDHIRVRMQSGKLPNDFYVAVREDYEQYLDQQYNYTYFCKKFCKLEVIDRLQVHKPVSVRMDVTYKYERGIIKEIISNSKVRVLLVDLGTTIETHVASLKVLSDRFLHYPAAAIHCCLDKNQLNETKLLTCVHPGNEFFITILEVGDNIEKPHVVKITPI